MAILHLFDSLFIKIIFEPYFSSNVYKFYTIRSRTKVNWQLQLEEGDE